MEKCHSVTLLLTPLLVMCVIVDLTSLETSSGHVKRTKTGQAVNQLVKVNPFEMTTKHMPSCDSIKHTVVDCGSLDDPDNGDVSPHDTTFGSIATYVCDTGLDLIGDMQRICQVNEDWSGSEPTCECKRSVLVTNFILIVVSVCMQLLIVGV